MKILHKLHMTHWLMALVMLMTAQTVSAERLKDLASVAGVRTNQLLGYGLVGGLDGTGDKTAFTKQSFKNMLAQFGIVLPAGMTPNPKNVAAVAAPRILRNPMIPSLRL